MAYMSSTESRVFSRCGPRLQLEPSKALHMRAAPLQRGDSSHSWHDSLPCLAALSGQPPKPEGARLVRAGLTAKARAEPQWPCFGYASRRDSPACEGRSFPLLHR
jgi:hypothetical protein